MQQSQPHAVQLSIILGQEICTVVSGVILGKTALQVIGRE